MEGTMLLQELDIPQDLLPYAKLQNLISDLNMTNYENSFKKLLKLLDVIDFHEICSNAFSIASRHIKESPLIAQLLSDLCHFTNQKIEMRIPEKSKLLKMFEVFESENVLAYAAKVSYNKELKRVASEPNELKRIIEADDSQSLAEYFSLYGIETYEKIRFDFCPLGETESKPHESTCLNYSALCGAEKCFKFFLLEDFPFNQTTQKCAIIGGSLEIIRLCVQHGCNFESELLTAVYCFRNDVFDWILLNYKTEAVSFNSVYRSNNIHAIYLCLSKPIKLKIFDQLLEFSATNSHSATLRVYQHFNVPIVNYQLFVASLKSSSLDIVNLLYHPKFIDKAGNELLTIAASNRLSVLEFAFNQRRPYICYKFRCALQVSIEQDDLDIAKFLLKYYNVPHCMLSFAKSAEMYKYLLVNQEQINDEGLLSLISLKNNIEPNEEIISLLVQSGVSTKQLEMLLFTAVKEYSKDHNWIPYLLKYGADIRCVDSNGSNLIHYACKYNKPSLIEMFVRAGVNPKKPNIFGVRPLCFALEFDVVDEMIRNGATTDFIWENNPFLLTLYIKKMYDLVIHYANLGFDFNLFYQNMSLFSLTVKLRQYDISNALLQNGNISTGDEVPALLALNRRHLLENDIDFFMQYFNNDPSHYATLTDKKGNTALHFVMASLGPNIEKHR